MVFGHTKLSDVRHELNKVQKELRNYEDLLERATHDIDDSAKEIFAGGLTLDLKQSVSKLESKVSALQHKTKEVFK